MSAQDRPQASAEQINRARLEYGSDDVNIDDDAVLSVADEGVWVSAWVWLDERHIDDARCDNPHCPCQEDPHARPDEVSVT